MNGKEMKMNRKSKGALIIVIANLMLNTVAFAATNGDFVSAIVPSVLYSTDFTVVCESNSYTVSSSSAAKEYTNTNAVLTNLSGAKSNGWFYVCVGCLDDDGCDTEFKIYSKGITSLSLSYENVSENELAYYTVYAQRIGYSSGATMSGTLKP